MKRMLINATQQEELRVAMVDGQKLYDLDIEVPAKEQKKSNIYKSKITRIEPSLEAVFVDYGSERHGFLPFKEITRDYFDPAAVDDKGRPIIKDALKIGQSLLIQVDKEERGNKGAALTTKISLAGRFLVLMPTDARAGGVSRRIEGDDRSVVRDALSQLDLDEGMGVIVRTAGVGRSVEELQWDLDYLSHLWSVIEKANEERDAPCLIYQESNVIIRALRDHYRNDIGEIYIDEESIYQQAHNFIKQLMPKDLRKLKKYSDAIPLFNRFQIESQIESAFNREVTLPSGGAIVIDHTEALTSIDINSGRATKGSDIEDTALQTNLEASDEIARQLRLRDLGGLIVIDFIDMLANKNQRAVEERLRNALKIDRARVQISRISRFGLLEMSRQRLRPSLGESSLVVCPRCSGHGSIRSIESLALAVLRLVEEEAMKDNTSRVIAQVPVDVATFLLNEKRDMVLDIESRNNVDTLLLPNPNLETPHFSVERVRIADANESAGKFSYEQISNDTEQYIPSAKQQQKSEEPAVKNIIPENPMPRRRSKQPGLLKRVFSSIFGNSDDKKNKTQRSNLNTNRNQSSRNNQKPRNQRGRNTSRNQTGNKQSRTRKNPQDNRSNQSQTSSNRNNNNQKNKSNRQEKQTNDTSKRSRPNNSRRSERRNAPKHADKKPYQQSQDNQDMTGKESSHSMQAKTYSEPNAKYESNSQSNEAQHNLNTSPQVNDDNKNNHIANNDQSTANNNHVETNAIESKSVNTNSSTSVSATPSTTLTDNKPTPSEPQTTNHPLSPQQTPSVKPIAHQYPPNALKSQPSSVDMNSNNPQKPAETVEPKQNDGDEQS